MSRKRRKWEILHSDKAVQADLAGGLGIPPLVARVLANRGIVTQDRAIKFLNPSLQDLHDPYLMPDMGPAVARIIKAIDRGESIMVYGDYDVDGITGTAVLVGFLRSIGAAASYYIPHRMDEGYGLNPEAIDRIRANGFSLMITVDCGVAAIPEVDRASSLSMDVIVTDHHEPGPALPNCIGVLNPKRSDSSYPFRGLAGVGVAFKLCQALWNRLGPILGVPPPEDYLDLVALGTIADVVPLFDENRVIAKHGMRLMARSRNLGIAALIQVAGIAGKEITASHVGFALAPRLNAAGRLGHAKAGVDMLLTGSSSLAQSIAVKLDEENRRRQEIEAGILRDALIPIKNMDPDSVRTIVLESTDWHPGVIGIVASKIAELCSRPTILISLENGEGRGSGRSIPGFDLHRALSQCSEYLVRYGGHAQAAGLSIKPEMIGAFRERLNEIGHTVLSSEDLMSTVWVDAEITEEDIGLDLARSLIALEPFGYGNPEPVFLTRDMSVITCRAVGQGAKHLKLRLGRNGMVLDSIWFKAGPRYPALMRETGKVDAVYSLEVNEWNGSSTAQLNLKDLRHSTDAANAGQVIIRDEKGGDGDDH